MALPSKVGIMTKRILDLGRVQWLHQELGLKDAKLRSYIDKARQPESLLKATVGAMYANRISYMYIEL